MDFPILTMSESSSFSRFTSVISPIPFPSAMDCGTSGSACSAPVVLPSLFPDPQDNSIMLNKASGNTNNFFIGCAQFGYSLNLIKYGLSQLILTGSDWLMLTFKYLFI